MNDVYYIDTGCVYEWYVNTSCVLCLVNDVWYHIMIYCGITIQILPEVPWRSWSVWDADLFTRTTSSTACHLHLAWPFIIVFRKHIKLLMLPSLCMCFNELIASGDETRNRAELVCRVCKLTKRLWPMLLLRCDTVSSKWNIYTMP